MLFNVSALITSTHCTIARIILAPCSIVLKCVPHICQKKISEIGGTFFRASSFWRPVDGTVRTPLKPALFHFIKSL